MTDDPSSRLRRIRHEGPTDPDLPGLNRPEPLGKMAILRRPVRLFDQQSCQYDVIAANDNGAVLAGPVQPIRPQLSLGRREDDKNHFFLVDVVEYDEEFPEGQAPWMRIRVRWNAFAGSCAGTTAAFAAEAMGVNLDARRVRITGSRHAAVTPPPRPVPSPERNLPATQSRKLNPAAVRKRPATPMSFVPPITPTPRSLQQHANKRGKTPVSMRRMHTPMSMKRPAALGPEQPPQERTPSPEGPMSHDTPPGMGPKTEDRLLKGREPIPLGSGGD